MNFVTPGTLYDISVTVKRHKSHFLLIAYFLNSGKKLSGLTFFLFDHLIVNLVKNAIQE